MNVTAALTSVTKRYGHHVAVEDVSLELSAREAVALVGHNGAGKSTLIKLMLGLIRPTGGSVRVLDADPVGARAVGVRAAIGYLPENVAFQPSMTGAEVLAFYARLKRQPASEVPALLARVGIAYAKDWRVGAYSKGMRQRLGLAQALLGQPRLLLLDEPTTGLDPDLRRGFYDIVRELRNAGATVLLSSHALAEIEAHVDRVIVMHRGRKLADGTIADLRRAAKLPTRIVVRAPPDWIARTAAGLPPATWRLLSRDSMEVACLDEDKMHILRQVDACGAAVRDLTMERPDLNAVYQAIVDRAGAVDSQSAGVPAVRKAAR